MKAVIYCRVSTDNQEREGTSLQTQLEHCLTYCKDKGYEVSRRFIETYSGLSLERPELDRLRELARTGVIDIIVCYSLDRLTRDPGHGVIIMQELEKLQVDLELVTEDVDNTELGKLISYIKGFAAKLEADKIRERTMRGKQAYLQLGKLPQGTGIGIYGYTWNKENKTREVNQFEATVIRDVFKRIALGESIISVARTLNNNCIPSKGKKLWHSLTIRRLIHNSAYVGKTYFKGVLLPDVSPAIVDEELFQAANAQLNKPKVRTGRPKHEYLLKNHVFCAICGKPLVGHCMNKKYLYYQCSNNRPYENNPRKCQAQLIRADKLENIVWDKTKEVLSNPDIILKQLTQASDAGELPAIEIEIKELEKALHNYDKRRSNLLQAMELDEITEDEVLDRLNNLKRLRTEDEARLNILIKTRNNIAGLANASIKLNQIYDQVLENLNNSTTEIKRLALDALDIKVYASTAATEIKGVIPIDLKLSTTAQTSA